MIIILIKFKAFIAVIKMKITLGSNFLLLLCPWVESVFS